MNNTYQIGVADTRREFQAIADFAADMPHTYGPKHREWAYGKLTDRMRAGQVVPYLAYFGDMLAAVAIAYPQVAGINGEHEPAVEFKLVRTVPHHEAWGLGRAAMKGAFNIACQTMELAPGSPVLTQLDTRNPDAARAFESHGFQPIDEATLYPAEPGEEPQLDVIYQKLMITPSNLYERC